MSKNTKKWPITRYKIKEIIHFDFKKSRNTINCRLDEVYNNKIHRIIQNVIKTHFHDIDPSV